MSLEGVARDVESARSQLKQAEAASSAWVDAQRRDFDNQRLAKLHEAGKSLQIALARAADQYRVAMQLVSER